VAISVELERFENENDFVQRFLVPPTGGGHWRRVAPLLRTDVFIWMVVSFTAARRAERVAAGTIAGIAVAFGTFCAFVVFNLLRVNVFLRQLTHSPDWQNLMVRFRASGSANLRWFINLDYLRGTPFKIGFFTTLGGVMGTIAGILGRRMRRTGRPTA
jgi:hypothetical protein